MSNSRGRFRIVDTPPLRALSWSCLFVSCAAYDGAAEARSVSESRAALALAFPALAFEGRTAEVPRATREAGAPPKTLEGCVRFALERSTRLQLAFERWASAHERAAGAGALPEPRLSWSEFVEELETRTGPQRRRIGLSQGFPWPGQLGAREALERAQAEALWSDVERARLEVARDVELAWHEYAHLGRAERINAELLALLRGLEPAVQSRVRGGGGQRDLLRLQIEIGRLEDQGRGLARRRPALWARLADAMSFAETPGELPAPEQPEVGPGAIEPTDREEAFERALGSSPALARLARELEVSERTLDLAELAGKPDFQLALDYFDTGRARAPVSGSGDDPFAVGLSMSLPVRTGRYAAGEREARHRIRAARLELDTAESSLRAAIEEAAFDVDDAARRVALYRDSLLPRASEGMRLAASSYRTGELSLLDLIDAERVLLEFDLAYWRASKEYHQGRARLAALIGGEL